MEEKEKEKRNNKKKEKKKERKLVHIMKKYRKTLQERNPPFVLFLMVLICY